MHEASTFGKRFDSDTGVQIEKMMKIKQYTANTVGRDFVVGDLHGCIDLFNTALDAINFDKSKDRMFSVGDLADRGPNSPACMDLMFEPWFHAVRSNHGDLMSSFYNGEAIGVYNFIPNGGGWFTELDPTTMAKYVAADKALPYVITVPMAQGCSKFHVIHAEFSTRKPLTDEILASKQVDFVRRVDLAGFEDCGDGPLITWGRVIFRQFFYNNIASIGGHIFPRQHKEFFNSDLSHIYSGHTVMKMPTRYLGQTNIDTGAVFSSQDANFGLTITEPATDKFWKTNGHGTFEVDAIVV